VTQQILRQYSGWEFGSWTDWSKSAQEQRSTLKPEDNYKPLLLIGSTVATNLAPFKYTPGMTEIEKHRKPHRDITRAIRRMRENILDPNLALYIPTEWWVSECSAFHWSR
jgi:hypothetical protein